MEMKEAGKELNSFFSYTPRTLSLQVTPVVNKDFGLKTSKINAQIHVEMLS